jgi:hypothetical protein
MRYLLLTYMRKPDGKMDETMQVSKTLRNKDLQMASVILDFRDRKVIKASLNGQVVPKDFDRIVGYYQQFYKDIIEQLADQNT